MPQSLSRFISLLENINRAVGFIARWFALLMVLIQFATVLLRYSFGYSDIAINDSVLYLHAALFMLGSGYTLLQDDHVRVDIFYAKASLATQRIIDFLGHLFLLIPAMLALLYWSWPSVRNAWAIREGALSVGGIPGVFLLKTLIPIFCVLLLIQSIACLLKIIAMWFGGGDYGNGDREAASPTANHNHAAEGQS